eukprot:GFKZ01015815.1.p1 GENE.GFKZ01015815.1~~GFKZ01015815.1.p1  ORF type:complete len:637 (-),score=136.48 GFKZ01015815.1:255-2165(-)
MSSSAFIPVITAGQVQIPPRFSRSQVCRKTPSLCANRPQRNESLPPSHSVELSPLPSRIGLPTLFNGPEAVLGVLLAAAALLADFAKGLARVTRVQRNLSVEDLEGELRDVDKSIFLLRTALDESKRALKVTEDDLDENLMRANSAEKALAGLGDSRDKMMKALDDAAKAEIELERIKSYLAEEEESTTVVENKRKRFGAEMASVAWDVEKREKEVEEITQLLDDVRRWGREKLDGFAEREVQLKERIAQRETEVENVKVENDRLNEEIVKMERRASTMTEQVSAAALALDETMRELERVQEELNKRKAESDQLELRNEEFEQSSSEAENLRAALHDMERELRDLQVELRERDTFVDTVAHESDELRSLLATRDAQLRDVSRQLISAAEKERERGGDPRQSELKLEEVTSNLEAEQLAFSAEIAKAEIATSDIIQENVNVVERLESEMDVEANIIRAGVKKAEAAVLLEEHQQIRKEGAINDTLDTLNAENQGNDLSSSVAQIPVSSKERTNLISPVSTEDALSFGEEQNIRMDQPSTDFGTERTELIRGPPPLTESKDYFGGDTLSTSDISSDDLRAVSSAAAKGSEQSVENETSNGNKASKQGQGVAGKKSRKDGSQKDGTPKRKRGRPRKTAG